MLLCVVSENMALGVGQISRQGVKAARKEVWGRDANTRKWGIDGMNELVSCPYSHVLLLGSLNVYKRGEHSAAFPFTFQRVERASLESVEEWIWSSLAERGGIAKGKRLEASG